MKVAFHGLIAGIFVFVLLPMLVVIIVSFGSGMKISIDPSVMSLKWYESALRSDLFRNALINSAVIGIISATVSTAVGLAAALAITRQKFRGRALIETFLLSPLALPGIMIGIALLMAFAAIGFRDAWWRLLLGHVLLTFPYCVRTIAASLTRLDPVYESAAETLGATPLQIFTNVTFPMIRPGVVAGALFAFIISFDNVPVSIFLIDANTATLPLAIISYLEFNFDPSVAAISSVIIVFMFTFAVILERLTGLKRVFGG